MYSKKNRVKQCQVAGETAIGTWVQMASPEIVEAAGYQGYDFVIIDMEHGHFGFDTVCQMVRAADAAGVTSVVRIPVNEESNILKVLDMGALGVLVPGITTREQALKAVKAAKYAPLGARGACPWTRATQYNCSDWVKHAQWSNAESMVWLLVEGADGVRNFNDIVTVPDIDAIMMGPFDLSQSLGIPGQLEHPLLLQTLQEMVRKAIAQNIAIIAVLLAETTPEEIKAAAQRWQALGCKIMTVGGDRAILCNGFQAALQSARDAVGE